MRRVTICTIASLLLLPAGVAAAKEPVAAKVCGPSDCRTVKDRNVLMALIEGGGPTDPPRRGAPWYSVSVVVKVDQGRRDSFPLVIVPSAGLMRFDDGSDNYTWTSATNAGTNLYRRVTDGLDGFQASTLEGVGPAVVPKAQVDEVVLPPEQPPSDGGGSSPVPWIAGAVVLLLALGLLIRRRGLPGPKPAEG